MKIRPKVRYKADPHKCCPSHIPLLNGVEQISDAYPYFTCYGVSPSSAKRIAAALNLHEAVRRGEVKVSK